MPPLLGKVLLGKISCSLLKKHHPSIVELTDCHQISGARLLNSYPVPSNASILTSFRHLPGQSLRWNGIPRRENLAMFFSTNSTRWTTEPGKLTSAVLGKIESAPPGGSSSSSGSTGGSAEEEEEKRRKDAFAKKAMKWSLVAMGLSFFGAAGFCILEWGMVGNI